VHWKITESIITIKQELRENVFDLGELDKRTVELIQKPIVCKLERDVYARLVECKFSDQIVKIVNETIEAAESMDKSNNPNASNAKSTKAAKGKEATKTYTASQLLTMSKVPTEETDAAPTKRTYSWSLPEKEETPPNFEFKPVAFNENEVDLINLVRVGFERLSQQCLKGKWFEKEVASNASEFIFQCLLKYIAEVGK
jgi:hypothetical protein